MKNSNNKWMNLLPLTILIVFLTIISLISRSSNTSAMNYGDFTRLLDNDRVTITEVSVEMNTTTIDITGTFTENQRQQHFYVTVPNTEEQANQLMDQLTAKVEKSNITIVNPYESNVLITILGEVIPLVLLLGLGIYVINRMNTGSNNKAFEFSKSTARLESNIKVKFSDVAGCDEEKEEMAEIIEYLRNPDKFAKMGAHVPKGILLVGAPGTGKTLLAKAVAGEADVPFYSASGSDFVEMFVGVGASRVRDMFKRAKSTAPCIIFIDEIDAVGRQRGAGLGGGNDEREQTLNELLVEMDGMNENEGIVVIAATNRPDVLDPALTRPGRFDRQITVSLPDRAGREAILKVHARNKHLADDIDLAALAARTPGFSGADLENVLNEAAILAVRAHRDVIKMEDLDEAIDRVMAGPAKKSRKYTPKEKKLVATHEAGHAVVGYYLPDAEIVQKVTIIPRGVAGGYNLMTPKEDVMFVQTKNELIAQITGLLGGRVAEEEVLGEISTGASNDLEKVTKIAKAMVNEYGMSSLGPVQYSTNEGNVFLGRDYNTNKNYSDSVAYEIDREVRRIVDESYKDAQRIIRAHRKDLDAIAANLIEYETLTREDLENIIKYGNKDGEKVIEGGQEESLDSTANAPRIEDKPDEPAETKKPARKRTTKKDDDKKEA